MLKASPKLLSRCAVLLALTTMIGVGMALAQDATANVPAAQKDSIMDYLTNHPEQAKQLHENPNLINDPNWLSKNPQVQTYLNKHPDLKSGAASNPNEFVNRAEMGTLKGDHGALNRTSNYLDKHPDIKRDLEKDPKLIDDPKYLAAHPALQKELATHPEIRNEAMNHPNAFKEAVERNDRYNERHRTKTHPTAKPRTAPAAKSRGSMR